MSILTRPAQARRGLPRLDPRYTSVAATLVLLVAALVGGRLYYTGFQIDQVAANLLINYSFLIVLAVGMTFVILTGGIDLSVGAVLALSTMVFAWLLEVQGWPLWPAVGVVLVMGVVFGASMGFVIQVFEIQPFIVTLAGMFMARGLCYVISLRAISITDPDFRAIAGARIALPGGTFIAPGSLVALGIVAVAVVVLHRTGFGRTVYAIGGNERSAVLMGLPVARTRVLVYAVSGLCSAIGGLLLASYMLSGYALHAVGMELDAIAAVVIGGTLLTGGSGFVLGSLLGVLVLGTIQTLIVFQGTLSSWWTKIVIGVLLFVFIVLQQVTRGAAGRGGRRPGEPPAPPVDDEDDPAAVDGPSSTAAPGVTGPGAPPPGARARPASSDDQTQVPF